MGTHRWAFENVTATGRLRKRPTSIPVGRQLDHVCHSNSTCAAGQRCPHRRCVNPAHLEIVTPKENIARGRGAATKNASKTHCKHGHPLSDDNLLMSGGKRICRECKRARGRATNAQPERKARERTRQQTPAAKAKKQAWVKANREHVRAYDREWKRAHS